MSESMGAGGGRDENCLASLCLGTSGSGPSST